MNLIVNGSFEVPALGSGYQYNPVSPGWTCSVSSGIQGNGSQWHGTNAPDGTQVAFLQNIGFVTQSVTLAQGTYSLTFQAARRLDQSNPVAVIFNGSQIGLVNPAANDFTTHEISIVVAEAGTFDITFTGTAGSSGGDKSSFIDAVSLVLEGAAPTIVGVPYLDVKVDCGAVGNALRLLDGAMTNGSGVLTCATGAFVSGDVGKGIGVCGAGVAGANLISTIATRQSAAQVTLAATASTTVSGKHVVYGADDTAAFQSAIDAAAANRGGGVIRVPPGGYFIAGPMRNTSTDNAQILFPKIDPTSYSECSIVIRGDIPALHVNWNDDVPLATGGAVIYSMTYPATTGWTGGAIFGGGLHGGHASIIPGSQVLMYFENLTFRTYPDPAIGCINAQNIVSLSVDNVTCDIGVTNLYANSVLPTHPNGVAIAYPYTGNQNQNFCGQAVVMGYYTGIRWYEFFCGQKVIIYACKHGVELPASYHPSTCQLLETCLCLNGITASGTAPPQVFSSTGRHRTNIGVHALEVDIGGGHWWSEGYELNDPNNYLTGKLSWTVAQTVVGFLGTYRTNGGENLVKAEL